MKTVEIEVDEALIGELIRRYHLRSAREAVNLALRLLVGDSEDQESSLDADDVDEYSDLEALRRPGA